MLGVTERAISKNASNNQSYDECNAWYLPICLRIHYVEVDILFKIPIIFRYLVGDAETPLPARPI